MSRGHLLDQYSRQYGDVMIDDNGREFFFDIDEDGKKTKIYLGMHLTHQQVQLLRKWMNMPLHGEHLRARTAFIKLFNDQYDGLNAYRVQLLEEMAEKDKEGKPILEGGIYKLSAENSTKFNDIFGKFLQDEGATYENVDKKMIRVVKEILTDKMLVGLNIDEGIVYDEVLTEIDEFVK